MAVACCGAFSCLDYSPSPHDKPCRLLWPFSQSTLAPRHVCRHQRSISFTCTARETLVPQSQNAAVGKSEDHSFSLQTRQNLADGAAEIDRDGQDTRNGSSSQSPSFSPQEIALEPEDGSAMALMKISDDSALASVHESEQVALQRRDDDEEKQKMKGYHAAKGALIKPLSADSLAYFQEGYLDTVTSITRLNWVTLVPTSMLPKGERLVLEHNQESVILFWLEDRIYAVENRSPAAPLHEEGFTNAVITEDGLITCPRTGSKFDVRTGEAVEWLPNSFFLERLFTPVLNDLSIYSVKASPKHIFINRKQLLVGGFFPDAEFSGNRIWTGPDYEEPIIFDDLEFGFTEENELTNGRLAMMGFLGLLLFEMTTGQGVLKEFGILDILYKFLPGFPVLRY